MLKHCKKSATQVQGDIHPKLVSLCHDLLAIPLVHIYNLCLQGAIWPDKWKNETVKLIPKTRVPESLKDVRNISCTPLFSKVLESVVLKNLRRQMSLSDRQFGGVKKLGIDHFLSETWHEIMMGLETENSAVNLLSIDFAKAYNRMDHGKCIQALIAAGVDRSWTKVVQAFLHNRTMAVHVNDTASTVRSMPGGAPQGSVLGSFLFCATTDGLSDQEEGNSLSVDGHSFSSGSQGSVISPIRPPSPRHTLSNTLTSDEDSGDEVGFVPRSERRRLMDSTVDSVWYDQQHLEDSLELGEWAREKPTIKAYVDDFNVIEKVRTTAAVSHFTEGRATYHIHAPLSERVFVDVERKAEEIGMIVNASKTQLLCISQAGKSNRSYIRPAEEKLKSTDRLKILGFVFGNRPDAGAHVECLVRKFNTKIWSLRTLKRTGMGEAELLAVYKSTLRPTLDFACVSYDSLLTAEQAEAIERLQMRAMKAIYGDLVSYRTVLEAGKIERLDVRRKELFEKFAMKVEKNERLRLKWLPLNPEPMRAVRRSERYNIPRMKTERGFKSPIIRIRRYLNGRA